MEQKTLFIKKYNYVPGMGNLYLIADFVIDDSPRKYIRLHKFAINYNGTGESALQYDEYLSNELSNHISRGATINQLLSTVIERQISVTTSEIVVNKLYYEDSLPLIVIESGESALYNLQFWNEFKQLKDQLKKAPRSKQFTDILKNMEYMPFTMKHVKE